MRSLNIERQRSWVADVRRQQGQQDVNEADQAAEDAFRGNGEPAAGPHVKASHPDRVEEASVDLHAHMTGGWSGVSSIGEEPAMKGQGRELL